MPVAVGAFLAVLWRCCSYKTFLLLPARSSLSVFTMFPFGMGTTAGMGGAGSASSGMQQNAAMASLLANAANPMASAAAASGLASAGANPMMAAMLNPAMQALYQVLRDA